MASGRSPRVDSLLEAFLEQSKDHVLLLFGIDETILWANAGSERVLGGPVDDLVGCNGSVLFTPEDVELGVPAHEFAIARSHGSSEDDRWMQRPDGSRFWASGLAYALRDKHGELMGYGKVFQNRTDWKEQQETLKHRANEFARSEEQRNRMISTFAHELRNPLSPLVNAMTLLSEGAPVEYPVKLIERQVDFIRRLVDDLLEATHVHAGKVQLRTERIVLQEVVAAAAETVRALVEEHEHRLELLLPPWPVTMDGDAVRLQQVFTNLLINAVKYTPRGGRIWVKATTEGAEAVMRFEDDGEGIAPDMLSHIFDLFAQVRPSTTAEGGVGIGLSLVKELVTLHGGTVQANSDGIGKGSEFIVRLPLRSHGSGALPPA